MEDDYKLPGQRPGEHSFIKRVNDLDLCPYFVNNPSGLMSSSIPINRSAVFIQREGSSFKLLSASQLRSLGYEMSDGYAALIDACCTFFAEQECQTNTTEDDYVPIVPVFKIISDDCFEISYASNIKCIVIGGQDLVCINRRENKPNFVIRCLDLLLNSLIYTIVLLWEILFLVGKKAGPMAGFLKSFGFGNGIDIHEFLKIDSKPIDPIDYMKVLGSGGAMVLLCYMAMSNPSSSFAYRLSGAAVLSGLVDVFWTFFSPLPFDYCLCTVAVCVCFLLHATVYEACLTINSRGPPNFRKLFYGLLKHWYVFCLIMYHHCITAYYFLYNWYYCQVLMLDYQVSEAFPI